MDKVSKLRVAVLAGGSSSERVVSLTSGKQVMAALESRGYECELIDPKDQPASTTRLIEGEFDVAFIAMHGKGGEDGAIQGFCETIGLKYTGSGIKASAIGMDKASSKVLYERAGIPTAKSVVIHKDAPYDVNKIVASMGESLVVKPNDDGSSVGMTLVHSAEDIDSALQHCFEVTNNALVEQYVTGMEITVAVMGNSEATALPVIQIVPHAEFYDFEVKYSPTGADHVIPAPLPQDVYEQAQRYAVLAHTSLGCRGVSRSDFIVDDEGVCYILETNTIPGMTPTSLLPDAARHMGLDFADVCERIIGYALEG